MYITFVEVKYCRLFQNQKMKLYCGIIHLLSYWYQIIINLIFGIFFITHS